MGYSIGRTAGPRIFTRKQSLFFRKDHLIATQKFYEEHGGKTIIIARFMPAVRTFAPVIAGVGGMNYRRFATFNIAGGAGWVFSMTFLGYFLGKSSMPSNREGGLHHRRDFNPPARHRCLAPPGQREGERQQGRVEPSAARNGWGIDNTAAIGPWLGMTTGRQEGSRMARTRYRRVHRNTPAYPCALVNYDAEARASPTHPKPNPTLPASCRFASAARPD